jgi:hypothetical protein
VLIAPVSAEIPCWEFNRENCNFGGSEGDLGARNRCAQQFFIQFPTKLNRETFLRISEISSRSREFYRPIRRLWDWLSDYGIYGYAMVSSRTFGDSPLFSLDHVTMAGPAVRQISFRIEEKTAILRSHGLDTLGDLLPFAAEFWRSSMTALFSRVLESPFPSKRMVFPSQNVRCRGSSHKVIFCQSAGHFMPSGRGHGVMLREKIHSPAVQRRKNESVELRHEVQAALHN